MKIILMGFDTIEINETENFVYCLANETKNESQSMFVSNII